MTDWSELKRLAEAEIALREIGKTADGEPEWIEAEELFDEAIGDVPKTFLALIAENERLSSHAKACEEIAEHNAKAFDELMEERDQLKAELERARAEGERLRNIAERACLLLEKGKFKSHNAVLAMRCIEDFAALGKSGGAQ